MLMQEQIACCKLMRLQFVSILGSYAKKQNSESVAQSKLILHFFVYFLSHIPIPASIVQKIWRTISLTGQ
jgi:hypothetical protein